jgi:hypothetical protein
MSTFHLLSQEKRDELTSMLPEIDQTLAYPPPPSSPQLQHPPSSPQLQHPPHQHNISRDNPHHLHHFDYYNNHSTPPPAATTTLSNNFFSKSENPIFWNTLSDWQTMLSQGEYQQQLDQHQLDSPPLLPLSPSPPTTTNNSSSNKSTTSTSTHHNRNKSSNTTKSSSSSGNKKDKFKVKMHSCKIFYTLQWLLNLFFFI